MLDGGEVRELERRLRQRSGGGRWASDGDGGATVLTHGAMRRVRLGAWRMTRPIGDKRPPIMAPPPHPARGPGLLLSPDLTTPLFAAIFGPH